MDFWRHSLWPTARYRISGGGGSMSHSVSRKGGEGQEKEKPDPRKPGCAHKGPGSTGSRVG
eukprot:scaffold87520_cov55-Phaeocystis_antarctica.AAC.7